jgi:glutamyl-tRNA reductase
MKTKQDLFDAIGLTLEKVQDRAQARAQIEALIEESLEDIVQWICDAVVSAAEADIRSRSGRDR